MSSREETLTFRERGRHRSLQGNSLPPAYHPWVRETPLRIAVPEVESPDWTRAGFIRARNALLVPVKETGVVYRTGIVVPTLDHCPRAA